MCGLPLPEASPHDRLTPLYLTQMEAVVSEAAQRPAPAQSRLNAFFLPDLCNTRSVLILLVVSEALVLALTLLETGLPGFSWQRFSIVSFFGKGFF